MTDPSWAPYAVSSDAASYPVHNAPPRVPGPDLIAFTWQQLQQIVAGFVNEFLRQVAVALGAIEIFGFHPYEALVDIGENIAAAKANFDAMFAGLAVGDVAGVLGYFGNLGTTGLYNAAAGFNNLSTSLLKHLTPTGGNIGQFDAAHIAGAFNTAVTIGGQAISSIFNGSGQFIGVLNAAATGALNTAITVGGTSLSTLFTNINSSGQLLLSGAIGALNTAVTIGGQAISSLFNGSGHFIGQISSSATGALNGAITLGGTALSTLSTNWNAAVTNINNLISGVSGAVDITDVYAAINDTVSNVNDIITNAGEATAAAVGTLLADAQTNATLAVNQIDDAIDNALGGAADAAYAFGQQLQTSFASWLSGWTGASAPPAASAPDLTDAIAAQRDAIVSISTAVAQLQAAAAASGSTGVFGGDDFERTDTDDLGPDWSLTYSGGDSSDGYIAISNGHQAKWVAGDVVTRSVNARRTATADAHTQTNYQKIVWTVGSAFELPYFDPTTGATGDKMYVRLRCRVKDDEASYVFAEIRIYTTTTYNSGLGQYLPTVNYGVQLGYKNGGSDTFVGSETVITAPAPGDQFVLLAGNSAGGVERYFTLLKNAGALTTWDDTGSTLSALGSSNLGWGFATQASSQGGTVAQGVPPALDSITIADNSPGPGGYASLPAAGNAGRVYMCSDVGLWLKDDGTDWNPVLVNDKPTDLLDAPPASSWSWVNQGGASTATEYGGERITAPSSTRNWRLRVRTLSPANTYTATARLEAAGAYVSGANAWNAGIGLRASGSGSFITWGPYTYNSAGYYAAAAVIRWTNATTVSAISWASPAYILPGGRIPDWWRIVDNNTNRYFQYSLNGLDWITVFSEGRTTYITPDQFLFGANNEGSGADVTVRLRTLTGIT